MDENKEFFDYAMKWLDENEPNWKLKTPVNREDFIKALKEKIKDRDQPIHRRID